MLADTRCAATAASELQDACQALAGQMIKSGTRDLSKPTLARLYAAVRTQLSEHGKIVANSEPRTYGTVTLTVLDH